MGAPKHPLFLMGRRFDNTDKQVSTPAGAALVRLQQHQTKLNHSLIHAAMVMSHFWHVNIAHPSRASSTGSVTRSRSIAACVQPAGLNGKDAIMLGVEPGVVSNNCQKPRSEVDSRHAAYAKDGTSERQQTVCPSTDLQAQHAATVEANAGLRCTDSNAQQVQSQMAGQLQSTKLFHQLSTKESVVPSLNDQTDRDIEAQHETAERPVNEAPVQAIRLSDDVAAEAARVEAIWADRELLYPEESINQMHTRPAILCRKLRKVQLVLRFTMTAHKAAICPQLTHSLPSLHCLRQLIDARHCLSVAE